MTAHDRFGAPTSSAMLSRRSFSPCCGQIVDAPWLISPYSGWKWAKWPSGDVGWLPADIELPATLRVLARNDIY